MTEKAFVGAGAKAGLEVWRIENLAPVKINDFKNKLYAGDSYIILAGTLSSSGKLNYSIHFWLGKESSQDETGVAAYKTVELSDALPQKAPQYREVQGAESDLFMSYFKTSGVEYLPGGVDSGFNHVVKDVWTTRLLLCKGDRIVRVSEVPLSNASLNTGDVFVLDAGLTIYIYNGSAANRKEKTKGLEIATNINNDERGGRATLVFLQEDPQNAAFWSTLGGFINVTKEGDRDDIVSVSESKVKKTLLQVSDASGAVTFTTVPLVGGKVARSQLSSADVFILNCATKIYIWVGQGSTVNEKKEATVGAVKFIKDSGLPANTPVERVSEGFESASFKAEFAQWDPPVKKAEKKTRKPDEDIDVKVLLARSAAEEALVDDGSGKVEVWVVDNFKLSPVAPALHGQFWGGDSYVVLYTYKNKNKKEEYFLYFWLGNASSIDEKGAAALLCKDMDDKLGGKPVQVRVTQGKEPAHFRQIFKGKTIIHAGGKASGFKNANDTSSVDTDGVGLFVVKGTNALNTISVQVAESASSLNSEDCFLLVTPANVFVWKGNFANDAEISTAINSAATLAASYQGSSGRAIVEVKEGSEPEQFWAVLGGKTEYASISPHGDAPRNPRLFNASTVSGNFKVAEVFNFAQSDLTDDDIYLLDIYSTLFVWVGSASTAEEKEKSAAFAEKFIADADDGRQATIVTVKSGAEPMIFTCNFAGWDAELANRNAIVDPYEAKLAALKNAQSTKGDDPAGYAVRRSSLKSVPTPERKEASPAPAPAPAAAPAATYAAAGTYFSLEELKAGVPAGVDPANKEIYLNDATFKATFSMDRAALAALPKWKRDAEKKKFGLF